MGLFKKVFKVVKKVVKAVTKPARSLFKATTKPVRKLVKQAIGAAFKAITPKIPKIPGVPDPASIPTFASAGGPASRAGFTGAVLGPSLISAGGITGLTKRAKTKKRTLIGGA